MQVCKVIYREKVAFKFTIKVVRISGKVLIIGHKMSYNDLRRRISYEDFNKKPQRYRKDVSNSV